MVIAFSPLQSIQRYKLPSFFLIKRIGVLVKDYNLQIYLYYKFLFRYSLKTFSLVFKRLYNRPNRGHLPFISSITSSYRPWSSNNLAFSLLNTSVWLLQAFSRVTTGPLGAAMVIYIIKRSESVYYKLIIKDLSPSITTFQYFLVPLAFQSCKIFYKKLRTRFYLNN